MNIHQFNIMADNQQNIVNLGFFLIEIKFNGKAQIHNAWNKSRLKNAFCGDKYKEMEIQEAFDKCKKWAKYRWENNDKQSLIDEYGLSKEFVKDYLGYVPNYKFKG